MVFDAEDVPHGPDLLGPNHHSYSSHFFNSPARVTASERNTAQTSTAYEDRRGRVDLDHPDYDKYPDSRLLQPVDVVMGPGDVMMFPRCCCTADP